MVLRLEESIAAVCAPSTAAAADLRVCEVVFETRRYLLYVAGTLLVVLVESQTSVPTPTRASDEAKRASRFELWQTWDARDPVRCVRFNPSQKVSRGTVALCLDEGRGVLLAPSSTTSAVWAARHGIDTFSTAAGDDIPSESYTRAHLKLHLPRWIESARWKCDDRMLSHLEWVESGDDLFLLGAGERLTIWKLVDDAVQVYFQRDVVVMRDADDMLAAQPVRHFGVAPTGRFAVTAGAHDRVVKLWTLGDLSPHESAPMPIFLAHTRALVSLRWSKEMYTFKARPVAAESTSTTSEMLFTLDRAGNLSIWRENAAPLRSFVLWKAFRATDFWCSPSGEDNTRSSVETRICAFGLVDHCWTRQSPRSETSVIEALLNESNVATALCLLHYGYDTLEDARRNELVNQRMDGVTQTNRNLLGDRRGTVADTHDGEAFICGNVELNKTLAVHLVYAVLGNGDLYLFREEFIPFSGVTPRISLLLSFDGLQAQLAGAQVYSVSSSDYLDRGKGSTSFVIEILFQHHSTETYFQLARLQLEADGSSLRHHKGARGAVRYSVQSCEVAPMCSSVMDANQGAVCPSSLTLANLRVRENPSSQQAGTPMLTITTALANIGGRLDVFRPSASLRSLDVVRRLHKAKPAGIIMSASMAFYEAQNIVYYFSERRFHVAMLTCGEDSDCSKSNDTETTTPPVATPRHMGSQHADSALSRDSLGLSECYVGDADEEGELEDLLAVSVPDSQKMEWSSNSSIFARPVASEKLTKDYSMAVGVHKGGVRLTVWVFSFALIGLDSPAASTQLFRKTQVDVPGPRLLAVSDVPNLGSFQVVWASFDVDSHLKLWTFTDLDDLQVLKAVHTVDVGTLMRTSAWSRKSHDQMHFQVAEEQLTFKQFGFSACGRVAILFEEEDSRATAVTRGSASQICFLPALESSLEGVVEVPHRDFGRVMSIQWTPPVTPERDCELLFLSTTTIGMLKFNCSLPKDKWVLTWSSSRFSVRPEKILSLSNYPYGLIAVGSSLGRLNIQDLDGSGASPMPLSFMSTAPVAPGRLPKTQPPSKILPAHHPITLMYLLARGSFKTLEKVLSHVKTRIVAHEEACYLRMADDTELRNLPLMSLTQILGDSSIAGGESEERSEVYLMGKSKKSRGASSYATPSAAPARASDLFAMDFGAPRRYGASGGDADRADMLFAPRIAPEISSVSTSGEKPSEQVKSMLETDVFPRFFNDHKSSLTFMTAQETDVFLSIVGGLKKTLAWERDSGRKKDEAALRFHASLLWPVEPTADPKAAASSTAEKDPAGLPLDDAVNGSAPPRHEEAGLCSEQVAWGAVSDFQDELLEECFPTSAMTWKEMKRLRLPFWLKSAAKLVQFAEKVAQAEYAATRDPFAVAVFYVLLGKTRLLASLFKMANERRIAELLSNDFSELRWKNAAIKNAYVLKTKQRYELSAAFFLLGGKVQEAVTVSEHSDVTLVLPFLIARVSEKWDLQGDGDAGSSSGTPDFSQASFTGLSTSLRGFGGDSMGSTGLLSDGPQSESSSDAKTVCVDFLNNTVWARASERGDVYASFLVKYLLGETSSAIDVLTKAPTVEMRSVFAAPDGPDPDTYAMYWPAFGQSLLGACDLVRFLRKTLVPMKMALKKKIVRVNTTAMQRMQGMGLTVIALVQQRDIAAFIQEYRRKHVASADVAAFLSCRQGVLTAAVGNQVDFLYATFLKGTRDVMVSTASPASSAPFVLEDRVNEEIRCVVERGGDFEVAGYPETSKKHVERAVKASVVNSLVHSGRLAALDFLVSDWSQSTDSSDPEAVFSSPLAHVIEVITEGVAAVASGDLMSAATDHLHTRKVDQTCSELLTMALRLLLWLQYYYSKPADQRTALPSGGFVRVAVAAIYSVICVCARYIKSPCCLYRVLILVFPHKDPLPKKVLETLSEIASAGVCVRCAALRRPEEAKPNVLGTASLEQDIPLLYQTVRILELELDEFTANVKTSRLHLSSSSPEAPTALFSHCPYWTLVVMMAASAMPAHLSKIAVDRASSLTCATAATVSATKLVEAWSDYSNKLAVFATTHVLRDLADIFFRPFSVESTPVSQGATPPASATGSPRSTTSSTHSISGSSAAIASGGSPRAASPGSSGSPTSTLRDDHDGIRQLLKCECQHCPWILVLKLFVDVDELLLRLDTQLERSSAKIDEEVQWGRLPEPAGRKAALTRSQKFLLSSIAEKAPSPSRAADLTDQLKRRMSSMPTAMAVDVQCVYRSDTNIKAMCLNRAAEEDTEMSVCSNKGIFRATCMDYTEGSRFQFKGMYAAPHAGSFFPQESTQISSMRPAASTSSTSSSGNIAGLPPPLNIVSGLKTHGSPSRLLQSALHSPHRHASPSESKAETFKPTAVASHPFLPLFASGNHKGHVHLWSYDRLSAVCAFQTKDVVAPYPSSPSMSSSWRGTKALEFDNLGQQLGAVDAGGRLFLWKFADLDRAPYYRELECHDKGARGLTFLNSSSSLATVGVSSEKKTVCVWDTLLPSSKALIAAPACQPAGATCVAFSSAHQLLISGGEGGALSVFDMRQRRVLHTMSSAHETPIKTLALHPSGQCVLSGSAGGDVKIWSLPIFREIAVLNKVHVKPSFLGDAASSFLGDAASNMAINVTNSSWGVTDAVATNDAFFTSGTDGSVQRLTLPSLGPAF